MKVFSTTKDFPAADELMNSLRRILSFMLPIPHAVENSPKTANYIYVV